MITASKQFSAFLISRILAYNAYSLLYFQSVSPIRVSLCQSIQGRAKESCTFPLNPYKQWFGMNMQRELGEREGERQQAESRFD